MKAIAALIVIAAAVIVGAGAAQSDMHAPFDKILDTYVREGQVYYRALKLERQRLLTDAAQLSTDHVTGEVGPETFQRRRREFDEQKAVAI